MSGPSAWISRAPDSAPALLGVAGELTGHAGPPAELTYAGLRRALSAAAADLGPSLTERRQGPGLPLAPPLAIAATSRIELLLGILLAAWADRPALPLPLDPVALAGRALPPGPGTLIGTGSASVSPPPDWMTRTVNWPRAFKGGAAGVGPGDGGAGWIVATSGTAGRPKLAIVPGTAIAASVAASSERLGLGTGDRWLLALPPDRIGGLMVMARALACGGSIQVQEASETEAFASTLATGRIQRVSVVPAMLTHLLDGGPPATRLATLLVGGAALAEPLADRLRADRWPAWMSYGMTETCSHVALAPVDARWQPGLAGRAVGDARIRAGDSVDEPAPITVSGSMLMGGYLGEPPLAGSFRTGDLGFMDSAGQLHVAGRADDVIVSGGVNVHPARVEAALESVPGVTNAAVGSVPDPRWGQRVVAVIVGPAPFDALEAYCRSHLPAAERPRDFHRARSLPTGETGKLDRAAVSAILRARHAAEPDGQS